MHTNFSPIRLTVVLFAASRVLGAQQASPIPIRTLAPPSAVTSAPIRNTFNGVIEQPGGRLLVNDAVTHRLMLFDSTLKTFTTLRDSADGLANSYGARAAILVPYVADSLLWVDMASQSLVVIAPGGVFGNTMAPPNPRDLGFFSRIGAGVDARGRIIYQGTQPAVPSITSDPNVRVNVPPDSAPILRADFDTRRVDTIARVRVSGGNKRITTTTTSGSRTQMIVNPITAVDGWALMPDGTVAIVRGHDYHIDWVSMDGTITSTPRMPFDWRRLTDVDKLALIDSLTNMQRVQDSVRAASVATTDVARAGVGRGGGEIRILDGRDVVGGASTLETSFVPLNEIADYYPPMRSGAALADREDNLWILPTTTAQSKNGELVYDVVNRKGEIVERVRLPEKRSIAAFGRGGVVYLKMAAPGGMWTIERTRVQR